jgi:hypothetical protein
LNDGSGIFLKTENWLPKLNISGSKVVPADFDGDGDMDLFLAGRHMPWSYPDPESSVILVNTGETFEDRTRDIAPELIGIGMVNDAVWVDFSGDGNLDLVIAGEWMPVKFFLNEGGLLRDMTEPYGLSENTGWWFGIEAADMDNDGDMDLVAGNFGLNSYYRGSAEEPFEIYYHDFDNNGLKDIVMAYYEDGVKYPYARKKDAAVQVPAIDDKFTSYTEYAKADLDQIYGREYLEMALHYQARMFGSMYIENQGNGKFIFHELPVEAQFSSINDMIIHDFNRDGNPDILAAGNMYAVEVKTPRNDAGIGVFLSGDGNGNFRSVNYLESGFFLPYDVKDLASISVNNTLYILAACNNDLLRVFRHNPGNGLSHDAH